ncbi:MAG: DUF1080 domain-containing protein [Planctomycetota bacterium]
MHFELKGSWFGIHVDQYRRITVRTDLWQACFACLLVLGWNVTAIEAQEAAKAETTAKTNASFRSLFDGETLQGWKAIPHFSPYKLEQMDVQEREEKLAQWWTEAQDHWSVSDKQLINDGKGPYLVTKETFSDYELRLQYKTVSRADSGIYLKGCPQVQIWDYTDPKKFKIGADKGSGGLWNNPAGWEGKDPLTLADRPFGEWNDVRVVQIGSRTSVWWNDYQVVDNARMDNYWQRGEPLPPEGSIWLQTHGGEIRWKHISIREIGADEANAYLAASGDDGFESVFDGKTLAGWQGAVDDYQVTDEGAIQCRDRRGGNLLTEGVYGDFVVRLEIMLPPGGNNGLAIRSDGSGDPAYKAMCELQVLDNSAEKYAKLDERQYHGSAYGMVAAKRGYQRPAGTWNFQEVTVQGSTVKVELNGNVILDADLATVGEYMGDRPHPGKERTEGHFGFAGHNDPVRFRNVRIKRLDTE